MRLLSQLFLKLIVTISYLYTVGDNLEQFDLINDLTKRLRKIREKRPSMSSG